MAWCGQVVGGVRRNKREAGAYVLQLGAVSHCGVGIPIAQLHILQLWALRRAVAGRPRAGQLSGVAAAASDNWQQQLKGFCYRCGGNHRVRECLEKRKVPANKGQKRVGCFRYESTEHFVRNCLQPGPQLGAATKKVSF